MELAELLERWNSGEGKPYKGSLIDWDAYERSGGDGLAPPSDIGCACAQGQILMLAGGWEPKKLRDTPQAQADRETAKLLNISRAHAVLLRNINDRADGAPSVVLTDPGKVLGDQWSKLLDFWWALDQFDAGQWKKAGVAWAAAWSAAWEVQGSAILFDQGRPFFFLPMFGWETPSDIPARPDDYGLGVVPTGGEA